MNERKIDVYRKRFPNLSKGLDDVEFANKLHSKYASNLSLDKFYKKLGVSIETGENNNSLKNFGQGILDSAKETINNLPFSNSNFKTNKYNETFPYSAGKFGGNIAQFLLTDGAISALSKANIIKKILSNANDLKPIKNISDKISPYLNKDLLRNALSAGVFGALTNKDNRLENAALDSAIASSLGIATYPIKSLKSSFDSSYGQRALNILKDKAGESVKSDRNNFNDLISKIIDNYKSKSQETNQIWNDLKKDLKVKNEKIDNSSYIKDLNSKIDDLSENIKTQSTERIFNKPAIDILNRYKNDKTDTLLDALNHYKSINKDLSNEINQTTKAPITKTELNAINFAKNSIKKSIIDNKDKINSDLIDRWLGANDSTNFLKDTFETNINNGIPKKSGLKSYKDSFSNYFDKSSILNDYFTKNMGYPSESKFEQLTNMIGDNLNDNSKKALKNIYLGNSVNESTGEVNAKKIIENFDLLSDSQKEKLFNKNELENFNNLKLVYSNNLKNNFANKEIKNPILDLAYKTLKVTPDFISNLNKNDNDFLRNYLNNNLKFSNDKRFFDPGNILRSVIFGHILKNPSETNQDNT